MKRKFLACLLTLCLLLSMAVLTGLSVAAAEDADAASTGVVATLTIDDKTTYYKPNQVTTALIAVTRLTAEDEAATLTLFANLDIPFGCAVQGNVTLDLNGCTLRTQDRFVVQKDASFTITDGASGGALIGVDYCPVQLEGGSLFVQGGKVTTENGDFAIAVKSGVLYLSGAPTFDKPIYTEAEKSIRGDSGADNGSQAYTGEKVTVYYGAEKVKDGVVVVENANGNFELERRGLYIGQSASGDLVYSTSSLITWGAMILAGAIILILLIILIIRKIVVKKKISKLSAAALLPIPFMAGMGDLQQILVLVVGVGLLAMIIIFIVGMIGSGKKLKKAKAKAAEKAAAAPAEEEAPAEETAEEAPAEEAAEETAAEEAAAETAEEEAPAEEAAEEETAEEEAPAEETAEEPAAEEAAAETAEEEAPAEEAAEEETAEEEAAEEAAEEAVAEETAEETAEEEAPAEEAAEEPAAEEEAPAEEAAEEPAAEETAEEETPAEETAEEPAAEEAAEEPAAEEAPAEEPAAEEEPVAAVAAEEEAEEQSAPIVNTLVSVPVVDAQGKTTSYTNYKKSFLARIGLASDDVKERYNTLKNALLSYKKVSARTSWSYESIKRGRTQLAKFAIRGKTLCLFLAIDPATLENSKYNVSDETASKKFSGVPCRLRLTSKRSVKWAQELIAQMAEKEQLVPNAKYKEQNYIPEARSDEDMLAAGLIKEVK